MTSEAELTAIGKVNPLRYRGYYYDTETGFYYLQSRYYDPSIGRFINADALASNGQGFLGYNMFAYCNIILAATQTLQDTQSVWDLASNWMPQLNTEHVVLKS